MFWVACGTTLAKVRGQEGAHVVKKGRHRRYEEARRFQRSSSFNLEEFDLDAPDPFALPDTGVNFDDDDDEYDDEEDKYAELARKYADFDDGEGDDSAEDDRS